MSLHVFVQVKDVCFAMLRLNHLLPHIDAAMQPGRMASRQLQVRCAYRQNCSQTLS